MEIVMFLLGLIIGAIAGAVAEGKYRAIEARNKAESETPKP